MTVLYGYLFDWQSSPEKQDTRSRANSFSSALLALGCFQSISDRRVDQAPRWSTYQLETPKRLHGVEQDSLYREAPYTYTVFSRVNDKTGTVVLASDRYAVTDEAVRLFNRKTRPTLRRKSINVKGLSDRLFDVAAREPFAITFLLADLPGFGSALSSMSLQGDDIGAANFSITGNMMFTTRQIGVRSLTTRSECGRFGNLGSVRFNTDMITDFEELLTYAYRSGFILD